MRNVLFFSALLLIAAPAFAEMGARLNFVGPKSVYAKVGLKSGDQVVDLDGSAPKSGAEVGEYIYARYGDGKDHVIHVLRDGKKVTLKF
jgi:membrane-associated protease RseP (regulator of RpoE activity)